MFCGESMFHRETDASKIALADLVARLLEAGAGLLEVQHQTPHLRSLGAIEIERALYLGLLRGAARRRRPPPPRPPPGRPPDRVRTRRRGPGETEPGGPEPS